MKDRMDKRNELKEKWSQISSSFEECLRSKGEIRSYAPGTFPPHITYEK